MSSRFDLAYNAGHALCLAALRQRNLGEYEGHLDVDKRFLDDLIEAVAAVADATSLLEPP